MGPAGATLGGSTYRYVIPITSIFPWLDYSFQHEPGHAVFIGLGQTLIANAIFN